MARLISSAPVLFVRDVRASAEHYRDAMGFRFDRYYGDPPSFVILGRDGLHVMLKSASGDSAIVPRWRISPNLWDVYFWVDNVEELYREFRDRGAKIDYELCDQPYGCREFGTQDIDEHDIGFGQVMNRENSK
jgi:catechol 2,3-dioxygenase-like lactoylglutathione lyase family enzyme